MNGISLDCYCTVSKFDYETKRLVPNLNFFSDLMAEQAELAKRGESKLTQEEIEELSGKCDMNQMSSQECKDLLAFLADKGVIDRPDPDFDPGERISYNGPQQQLLAEGAEAEAKWGEHADLGPRGVVYFLSSYMEERFQKLLAEQVAAEALRNTGRLV